MARMRLRVRVPSLHSSLVAAALFAIFLGPAPSLKQALRFAVMIGPGWVFTSFGINYQFAQRPWRLWLIDAGYHAMQFVLFGLILGLWH